MANSLPPDAPNPDEPASGPAESRSPEQVSAAASPEPGSEQAASDIHGSGQPRSSAPGELSQAASQGEIHKPMAAESGDLKPHATASESGAAILRFGKPIVFCILVLCLAGAYSAYTLPSSVFPHTDFPRVVILIDNGVMPADEMMATITRPVEESMKDIPGTVDIRSVTGRGSAEVNVFFDWQTDMVQSELYVLTRISQIRSSLPAGAQLEVHRLTFSAFPMIGISLTSDSRSPSDVWELARYHVYPKFLQIPGVARVKIVGGRVPEYHVVADPAKLAANHLTLEQVSQALADTNQFTPTGMHEENYQLYLTVVDSRLHNAADLRNVIVTWNGQAPVRVRDVAVVERGEEPQFNRVTADGKEAVLLNVFGQPNGNAVSIADALRSQLGELKKELPPDAHMAFFYDQSQFVREGMQSVWESIFAGVALSVLVLYLFLRSGRATLVATTVIPVTVLITLLGLRLAGMSLNLMTLGGIAAVVGLVIDDAIVMVEAIYTKVQAGASPAVAVRLAMHEVGPALVGSTLTPVVVFLPMAFVEGVPGVFFRALAMTMTIALLTSLVLAVTWTPVTAALLFRAPRNIKPEQEQGGRVLHGLAWLYAAVMRVTLGYPAITVGGMALIMILGYFGFTALETDFLPAQDEGAFIIDYYSRPGTSLTETNRMLMRVERILKNVPEVESFSRRTGARLALAVSEPNTGDFLVKLKQHRSRRTSEVIDALRGQVQGVAPSLNFEFPGVLSDLIGDLTWSPAPVEIKLFSTDVDLLKKTASEIAGSIEKIPGVVDVNDGLVVAGPSLKLNVLGPQTMRAGLTPKAVGSAIQTAMLGTVSSYVLTGDRIYPVRVLASPESAATSRRLTEIPLRSVTGAALTLGDVVEVEHEPGMLEVHREDLRQYVAVSARFSGIDLGHGIRAIQNKLSGTLKLPPGMTMEYGGTYQQQQQSFRNLAFVLAAAILLVYGVLVLEFRTLLEPVAIVLGASLALVGVVAALWLTGTSLNIVSFLGAIIGVGIVAKNGILMLDFVDTLRARGLSLAEALVQSGRRRLRPVLMTTLTAFLGLLPLAYGVGAGADMLKPMAIGVIGALFTSLILSLVATPVSYYLMVRLLRAEHAESNSAAKSAAV